MPIIGSQNILTPVGELIMEIRDLIPDPVDDPSQDGAAFSLASILRFINHAGEEMCQAAPIIEDWYGIPSEQGMDVYELDSKVVDVRQLFYDLWPCWRSPEYNGIFTSKISSRSYFFGPHTSHYVPKIHVWPCADRSGFTTTLSAGITITDRIIPLTATGTGVTGFRPYGLMKIDNEIILYRTVDSTLNQIRQVLRGQYGTTPVAHLISAPVTELNIMMKVSRLPQPILSINDPFEVPAGLIPILETGVMAHIRMIEQEFQEAKSLRTEFDSAVKEIATKGNKIRQGTSIRVGSDGPLLYGGRVIVP
jgi:hypothetical protein